MYKRWCFTLNNYSVVCNWEEFFNNGCSTGNKLCRYVVGYEIGESGTRHLQGYCVLSRSQRLSYVTKLFDGAHWEGARGSDQQNYDYCTKSGSFFRGGDWNVLSRSSSGSSDRIRDVIKTLYSMPGSEVRCSSTYVRSKRAIDEVVSEYREFEVRKSRFRELSTCLLKLWQMSVLLKLFNQNDRQVLWVVDVAGGCGKTFLSNILFSCYSFDLFDGVTQAKDICFLLSETINGIVFDVTRSDSSQFSYQTLEACKNGFVMTGKYMGKRRVFKSCPVVIFSNCEPDLVRLSSDRWVVYNVPAQARSQEAIYSPQALWPFKEIEAVLLSEIE
ncbi:replication-associated protein [Dragonfly orbiculatusvirus]|uniref:replication-associated protein n=1 Tax=Dragonfly orbiculatusvirus TaxID=1234874 RepID=UPI00028ADD4D|nr:replication-associated protein [Dragonfly orbiculatusvirus]AFS65299.1 replication-associated protein [Dragonfly orbiculatusvirus]